MRLKGPKPLRDTVYVIGAGFSAGLGYPLTKGLLIDVWSRLNKDSRNQLHRIIKFHHPGFTTKRKTTFPDIEQLLTEIAVNLDLFYASRPAEGTFTKKATGGITRGVAIRHRGLVSSNLRGRAR